MKTLCALSEETIMIHYTSFSDELKAMFGHKVYKLSLSSGCTCPNRDGTLGTGGCTFCSQGGSGEFAASCRPLKEQLTEAKEKIQKKFPAHDSEENRYIAYFQSFTNTYGDTRRLTRLYQEAISYPEIAGLAIGTRPDCLEEEKIRMLAMLARQKPVWVELGLQTIHENTAISIHRGYSLTAFQDAYERLKQAKLRVVVHVILGLPGETREDMLATVQYLANLRPVLDGIKLQLLHILKGTALAEEYLKNPFPLMTLEEYADLIQDCLVLLPKETVIHRLTGDGPKKLLIAPLWSADKKRVLNRLKQK